MTKRYLSKKGRKIKDEQCYFGDSDSPSSNVFKERGERAKFHRKTGINYINLSLMTLKPGFTPMDI